MDFRNHLTVVAGSEYQYKREENTLFVPPQHLSLLIDIIKGYPFSSLNILSTSLINNEVIKAIRDNQHLSFIKLGSRDDVYTLTREVFDILNSSESLYVIDTDDVVGKYTTREMEYLPYFERICIKQYRFEDFLYNDSFHFSEALTDKEMENLKKYLKPYVSIFLEYEDYGNIIHVIESLKGKNIVYNIIGYDSLGDYFPSFQKLIQSGEKIYIVQSMSLDKYMFVISYLESMVKDIKESNLSPYENYLGVYEIVTHFKEYLDNVRNTDEARELEYLLFNEFYVCYGFSELAVALLERVGIKAVNVEVDFFKEKEEVTLEDYAKLTKEQIKVKKGNRAYHSRILLRLQDSKYDIDGLFFADATWDNSLEHHYFNHSLMTPYETSLENKTFYDSPVSVFNISSAAEFMVQIFKPGYFDYFLEVIKKVDYDYYKILKKKYAFDLDDPSFLNEIYNYIIMHTKRGVSLEKKNQALYQLFHFIYPTMEKEKLQEFLYELQQENKERDTIYFKKGKER